jgi:hypothetical protein
MYLFTNLILALLLVFYCNANVLNNSSRRKRLFDSNVQNTDFNSTKIKNSDNATVILINNGSSLLLNSANLTKPKSIDFMQNSGTVHKIDVKKRKFNGILNSDDCCSDRNPPCFFGCVRDGEPFQKPGSF